jgi:hypothetical protein
MHAAEVKLEAHELNHKRHEENEQCGADQVCLEHVVISDLRKFKQTIDCYSGLNMKGSTATAASICPSSAARRLTEKLEYANGKLKERKIRVTFAAWAGDTQVV